MPLSHPSHPACAAIPSSASLSAPAPHGTSPAVRVACDPTERSARQPHPQRAGGGPAGLAATAHRTTLRMNPYVRCVRVDNTVPSIKSLEELLVMPVYADPAEADTPCLHPRSLPAAAGAEQSHGETAPATNREQLHTRPMAESSPPPPQANSARACACGGAVRTPTPHARTHGAQSVAPSQRLSFTVDSVATPNTFATATRELGMPLSYTPDSAHSSSAAEQCVSARLPNHQRQERSPSHGCAAAAAGAFDDALLLLPISTSEVDVRSRAREGTAPAPVRCGALAAAAVSSNSSGSGNVSPLCGCAMPSADVRQSAGNIRILSPRTHRTAPADPAAGSRPVAATAAAAAAAGGEKDRRDTGPGAHCAARSRPHRRPSTPPLPSACAPVARIEESPYHYIMRNFVGGTFLYYASAESKEYFLNLCWRVVRQVTPILERETLQPEKGLFPTLSAPAFVLGDVHGNFEDLAYFLRQIVVFHDFNLTPSNLLCLGDYVDRGPFSLECVMLLFSLKIMNADKIVLLRGNHEDRVVCGDLQTYGMGCFAAQCQTVFGYGRGMELFRAVTALFRYLPLACELIVPFAPNALRRGCRARTGGEGSGYLSASTSDDSGSCDHSEDEREWPGASGRAGTDRAQGHAAATGAAADVAGGLFSNLYVSQPSVPIAVSSSSADRHSGSHISRLSTRHPMGADSEAESAAKETRAHNSRSAGREDGGRPLCGVTCSRALPSADTATAPSTAVPHAEKEAPASSSPSAIASATGQCRGALRAGLPWRAQSATHEERILCTHGGIPRFARAPRQDGSLDFLRSLYFPRLLTLFPNNGGASGDPQCALDYYARELLDPLLARHQPPPRVRRHRPCAASASVDASKAAGSVGRDDAGGAGDGGDGGCCSLSSTHNSHSSSSHTNTTTSSLRDGANASELDALVATVDTVGPSARPTEAVDLRPSAQRQPAEPHPRGVDEPPLLLRAWYVAFDLLWSDPTASEPSVEAAPSSAPPCLTNEWGFGMNTRGSSVISYSAKAVETFLAAYEYSMLFRAHQEKAHGLRWSKHKRVLTIFSSSNYLGHRNGAGCVMVSMDGEVHMVEKLSNGYRETEPPL